MQILYDRIRKDGIVRAGNVLKVDRFLNSPDGYSSVPGDRQGV